MKAKVKFQDLTIKQIKALTFTTISAAKKDTGISYPIGINVSAKTEHGAKFNIDTAITYFAPHKSSGCMNVCPAASPECIFSCLEHTGRVAMEKKAGRNTIQQARINRTRLFFYNPEFFMAWVIAEIASNKRKAAKKGNIFAVRLNGTSDIKYENVKYQGKTIFEIFPDVTFYDYTKIPGRKIDHIPNYSLTFSYTGRNTLHSVLTLERGENVAIVFDTKKGKPLPKTWKGFQVIDGDVTDYRPADPQGCVVGLRLKLSGNKEADKQSCKSVFVVNETSPDCVLVSEAV